jgi:hypothetical protein
MVKLNVVTDLSTFPITRQTLYDMWGAGKLTTLSESDLSPDFMSLKSQPSEPTPSPGRLWWSTQEQLLYCYHDVVDDTGVSLWLVIGPDRFEIPALAAEPIPPGAVVEPWYDKWCKVANYSNPTLGYHAWLGPNQSGVHYPLNEGPSHTTPSGSWFRVGVTGIVYGALWDGSGVSAGYHDNRDAAYLTVDPLAPGYLMEDPDFTPPDFNHCAISYYDFANPSSPTEWGYDRVIQHAHVGWWGHMRYRSPV